MAPVSEQAIMRKVAWRLVPFLGIGYFINALDRTNISIAALTMNKSLGLSAAQYGLGAGAFFWSYILFQVPANMILARLGARRWITIIMVLGAVFGCNGAGNRHNQLRHRAIHAGHRGGWVLLRRDLLHDTLVPRPPSGPGDGRVLRLRRAGVFTGTHLGQLLALHGWLGLPGWQWIFLLEARPLSCSRHSVHSCCATSRPTHAGSRTTRRIGCRASSPRSNARQSALPPALCRRCAARAWFSYDRLSLIGFGVYANVFFLPLIIKDMGFSNIDISYLAAVPAALGAIGMIVVSRSSDRTGERVWHVTVPTLVAALGLIAAGLTVGRPVAELIALCVVGMAISSALPTFWNLPTAYLGAGAAAAGIATHKLGRQHLRLSCAAACRRAARPDWHLRSGDAGGRRHGAGRCGIAAARRRGTIERAGRPAPPGSRPPACPARAESTRP